MKYGVFVFVPGCAFHSKNPSVRIRHLLYLKPPRKDGFSAIVSPRALISLLAIDGSFDHEGISPHRKKSALFLPSFGMASMGCVGAMLKRGAKRSGKVNSSKISSNSSGFTVRQNLPHMFTPVGLILAGWNKKESLWQFPTTPRSVRPAPRPAFSQVAAPYPCLQNPGRRCCEDLSWVHDNQG